MDAEQRATIDARLARFAATRHARDLWPHVSVSAFRAAHEEVARVAALLLSNAPAPVSLHRPPGADVHAFGVAAFAAGMGALLGFWCETGRVTAEPAVADLLAIHLDHGRRRAARLREAFERVLVALADRGIDACVLKGMHTGYRYFPEPGVRPVNDVDLLVRPDDWHPARGALRDLGFTELTDATHPQQTFWSLPGAQAVPSLELTHVESPWSVDLHRSLDRTPFEGLTTTLGSLDRAAGEVWREFCRPIRVLPQPLLLAYLALHASSHFYTIPQIRLIELVLVARRDFAGDAGAWRAFDQLVARTRTGRFVFPALDLAERFVPGSIAPSVLEHAAAAAPRRLRRLVRRIAPASALSLHPFPGLRERFVWVASLKEALAALAWLAWPRDGERWASPGKALAAQARRLRRAVSRIVRARLPH